MGKSGLLCRNLGGTKAMTKSPSILAWKRPFLPGWTRSGQINGQGGHSSMIKPRGCLPLRVAHQIVIPQYLETPRGPPEAHKRLGEVCKERIWGSSTDRKEQEPRIGERGWESLRMTFSRTRAG